MIKFVGVFRYLAVLADQYIRTRVKPFKTLHNLIIFTHMITLPLLYNVTTINDLKNALSVHYSVKKVDLYTFVSEALYIFGVNSHVIP